MLTVKEVADRLKVHPITVYRWIAKGKLKALRINGILRVPEEVYYQFIRGKQDERR